MPLTGRRGWHTISVLGMPKFSYILLSVLFPAPAIAQSLTAGTIKGMVADPSNAPIASAEVVLSNPITGSTRQARAGNDGSFVIPNIPPNRYRLQVSFAGFQTHRKDVSVQNAVPVTMTIRLELAGQQTSVTVLDSAEGILETKTSS